MNQSMVTISGMIHDSNNGIIQDDITIEAFQNILFGIPLQIGSATSIDHSTGFFKIDTIFSFAINLERIYLIISDPNKRFISVRIEQREFEKTTDDRGNVKWQSELLESTNNLDITINLQLRDLQENKYESVVIGSGFGGTIVALTLANKYQEDTQIEKRICMIERGQWWTSHEVPIDSEKTIDNKPTLREYLEKNNIPYGTWVYPDNLKGLFKILGSTRTINSRKGLYDYTPMRNVHVISASGVGGGSLVYFNTTAKPDNSVYNDWPIQDEEINLDYSYSYMDIYNLDYYPKETEEVNNENRKLNYFNIAENFLGINSITTTAGLGKYKLSRHQVFQDAAKLISSKYNNIIINSDDHGLDFSLNLSITDVPAGIFSNQHPTTSEKIKYSSQYNVCQRQGRCGLGCIVNARHTLDQYLYKAIVSDKPIDILPLCKVNHIEENKDEDTQYKYKVFFDDFRDSKEGIKRTIKTKQIILAGGSLGSTEILLRSKEKLDLSSKLGTKFSTNGDIFGVINPTKYNVDSTKGPMQTSIARFKDKDSGRFAFCIEDIGIPKMFAEFLAPLLNQMVMNRKENSFVSRFGLIELFTDFIIKKINDPDSQNNLSKLIEGLSVSSLPNLMKKIIEIRNELDKISLDDKKRSQTPDELVRNILMVFGIGVDESKGQIILDINNKINLKDPYDLHHKVFDDIVNAMKSFAEVIGNDDGEKNLIIPLWNEKNRSQVTAHPLGGCPMGKDSNEGVVDRFGRVFKGNSGTTYYDDLYVVDGSIIPNSLGVNPSLTICALSFRLAENIVGSKKYWPKLE